MSIRRKKNNAAVNTSYESKPIIDINDTASIPSVDLSKLKLTQQDEKLHDQKFETQPVGYFKDAYRRFKKDRSSVIGTIIILFMVVFAIVVPFISGYGMGERDGYYQYVLPKCKLLSGTGFWDGTKTVEVNETTYDLYSNIPGAVVKTVGERENTEGKKKGGKLYKIVLDTYAQVGYINLNITADEYEQAKAYEKETGNQIFYPIIDQKKVKALGFENNANMFYLTNEKGVPEKDKNGNIQPIYVLDENGNEVYEKYSSGGTQAAVRVLYSEWYRYKNGKEACFLFGADSSGYDILTRMAGGARLSFILSIIITAIDLLLGTLVGALQGYYGGVFDLILERIKEIIIEVPTMVIFTLFQLYLADKAGPLLSLMFAFVFFGWVGSSGTVRAQMYRFKGQEYVLAARTLGARDRRIIFRHVLPNGIGYIITASALSVPSVILSEATMSYLGIVNLKSDAMTSIGTLLNNGQATLFTYPHCVFFPAVFIALLLICFNLFGNGLRDALNPALRGSSEK